VTEALGCGSDMQWAGTKREASHGRRRQRAMPSNMLSIGTAC
jgi:hypothetical protein